MTDRPATSCSDGRSGFTLIELLVAMALFALISLAGFTLLSGIIGTRDRLDGRLVRVGELQRAMYVMTLDLESLTNDGLEASAEGLAFRRLSDGTVLGNIPVRYHVEDHALRRRAAGGDEQILITNVSSAAWRFSDGAGGWRKVDQTPPALGQTRLERPRAIEITLTLSDKTGGLSGSLRRVVELPRQP